MLNNREATFLEELRIGLDVCRCSGRVLIGVSGGADSVALLRGVHALAGERRIEPVAAHLDHRLRAESADDAAWVAALAERLQVPFVRGMVDVRSRAAQLGVGLEEAARRERYDFLVDRAISERCTAVAVAHTADDQVETVLHHVVRGTGLAGLRGMPRERRLQHSHAPGLQTRLVRPLLEVPRSTVVGYLTAIDQPFLDDATNADPSFTRNRIRTELLPLLESSFNPRVREALLRLSSQAGEAVAVIDGLAAALLDTALLDPARYESTRHDPARQDSARLGDGASDASSIAAAAEGVVEERVRLGVAPFVAAAEHVARAALVELWRRRGWPRQAMGAAEWQRLLAVVREGGAVDLPGGVTARRQRACLDVTRRP